MLNMAHLMTLNDDWKGAGIRLFSITRNERGRERRKKLLEDMLEKLRIKAEVEVITSNKSIEETIKERSSKSDIVILGLGLPKKGREEEYYKRVVDMAKGLKSVLFVRGRLD